MHFNECNSNSRGRRITSCGHLALVCILLLIFSGCSKERENWEAANNANTIDAYEAFLEKYPSGILAEEARESLASIYRELWDQTKRSTSKEAYQEFLQHTPPNNLASEAQWILDVVSHADRIGREIASIDKVDGVLVSVKKDSLSIEIEGPFNNSPEIRGLRFPENMTVQLSFAPESVIVPSDELQEGQMVTLFYGRYLSDGRVLDSSWIVGGKRYGLSFSMTKGLLHIPDGDDWLNLVPLALDVKNAKEHTTKTNNSTMELERSQRVLNLVASMEHRASQNVVIEKPSHREIDEHELPSLIDGSKACSDTSDGKTCVIKTTQAIEWGFGFCADGLLRLTGALSDIEVELFVDDDLVPKGLVYQRDQYFQRRKGAYCHTWTVKLAKWRSGASVKLESRGVSSSTDEKRIEVSTVQVEE